MTPRQTDLSLEAVVSKFHDKQIKLEETAFRDRSVTSVRPYQCISLNGIMMYHFLEHNSFACNADKSIFRKMRQLQLILLLFFRFLEEQRYEEMLQQKREELINKYKDTVARRSEMLARIQ